MNDYDSLGGMVEQVKSKSSVGVFTLKLLLVPFGLVVALALLELCLRLFVPGESAIKFKHDRPETFFFDERALDQRDYFYPAKKAPGTFRVVVIGDSFTFGTALEFDDTFSKRVERILNLNTTAPHVEVINLGVPGSSTIHQVLTVKRAIESFSPDLVLLEITLNDPEQRPYLTTPRPAKETLRRIEKLKSKLKFSRLAQYVLGRIYNEVSRREYLDYYQGLFTRGLTLQNFRVGLSEFKKACDRRNVAVGAVIFPLFGFPFDERYPFISAHNKTHEFLENLGYKYLDLFEAFRGRNSERLEILPGEDSHPNEIAHRIASEYIVKWLGEQKLVPEAVIPHLAKPARHGKVDIAWPEE